jgi:hypothetical protein
MAACVGFLLLVVDDGSPGDADGNAAGLED